jgi:hypothetical protein
MDVVGLIRAIEDYFGIEFPSDGSMQCSTFGDLFKVIMMLRPRRIEPSAAAQVDQLALDRIRTALSAILGSKSAELEPSTDLRNLIPFPKRRRVWAQLQRESGLRLPQLLIPRWILFRFHAAVITFAICFFPSIGGHALVLAVSILLIGLICLLPFAVAIQPDHRTLAGLSEEVAKINFARLAATGTHYQADEVWAILVNLTSLELGVPAEQLVPSARWVQDLGCET